MRILHTSDWHLGASLEGVSRDADHAAFLSWLAGTLEREAIEVLVVAGDVFDQAHPSSEAQRLYFNFLTAISGKTLRKVVIVGGNHDSASRLDAPAEVLQNLSVHVVGGLQRSDEAGRTRCICPIRGERGGTDLVVLAVPFVHEYWLRVQTSLATSEQILRSFQTEFTRFYRELADQAEAQHQGAPLVATGHLTCAGANRSDAPADIHMVGSIGGLPPEIFDDRLRYVALGHIHRSYRVAESRAYYSGSPISLSLGEAKVPRTVRVVDVDGPLGEPAVRTLTVPEPRPVRELKGKLESVAAQLRALDWDTELPPIVYATVEVEHFRATAEEELKKALTARKGTLPLLVRVQQLRTSEVERAVDAVSRQVVPLDSLTPEDVFRRLCHERKEPLDEPLLNAFQSLLSAGAEERDAP